jgi:hypothetical protein
MNKKYFSCSRDVISHHQDTVSIRSAQMCFPGMQELSQRYTVLSTFTVIFAGKIFCKKVKA